MIKKIFAFLCLFILSLVACTNTQKIDDYYSDRITTVEENNELKNEIETAYKEKYSGQTFEWPTFDEETTEFLSNEELQNFRLKFRGMRFLGKCNDKYILGYFALPIGWHNLVFSFDLYYNTTILIDGDSCMFACELHNLYLYSNGNIIEIEQTGKLVNEYNTDGPVIDISTLLDISLEEAQKIANFNDKFNEKYFKKFLNEEERKTNDYSSAYNRIKKSLPLSA